MLLNLCMKDHLHIRTTLCWSLGMVFIYKFHCKWNCMKHHNVVFFGPNAQSNSVPFNCKKIREVNIKMPSGLL